MIDFLGKCIKQWVFILGIMWVVSGCFDNNLQMAGFGVTFIAAARIIHLLEKRNT